MHYYLLLLLLISCQVEKKPIDSSYLKQYTKKAKNYFWERSNQSHFTSSELKSLPSSPKKRVLYYFQKGQISMRKRNYVDAVSFFQKAYNMMENLVPLVGRVSIAQEFALSLMKVKQYSYASRVISKAIELEKQEAIFSRLPFLYYYQGIIYSHLKKKEKARASWKTSLFYSNQFNDIRYHLLAKKKLNKE